MFLFQHSILFEDFSCKSRVNVYFVLFDCLRVMIICFIIVTFPSRPFTQVLLNILTLFCYFIAVLYYSPHKSKFLYALILIIELGLIAAYSSTAVLAYYEKNNINDISKRLTISKFISNSSLAVMYSSSLIVIYF